MITPDTAPPAASSLQFDQAEPTTLDSAGVTCTACSRPIHDAYHEVNGQVVCTSCRAQVEALAESGGFFKAFLFGTGAAVAGWAIYFAILKLTDIEFGLIAVLVGFMVGKAVATGSGERGGWLYRTLAVGLTYLAIVCTYMPLIADAFRAEDPEVGGVGLYIVSFIVSLAGPFLVITESPITLLIVGFGLYQAWRMNARRTLEITGPYAVAAPQPALDAVAG